MSKKKKGLVGFIRSLATAFLDATGDGPQTLEEMMVEAAKEAGWRPVPVDPRPAELRTDKALVDMVKGELGFDEWPKGAIEETIHDWPVHHPDEDVHLERPSKDFDDIPGWYMAGEAPPSRPPPEEPNDDVRAAVEEIEAATTNEANKTKVKAGDQRPTSAEVEGAPFLSAFEGEICNAIADDVARDIDREIMREMLLPPTPTEAFETFLRKWEKEPPLIRASMGLGLVKGLEVAMNSRSKDILNEKRLGMDRRAKVTGRILVCEGWAADLFIALTNQADAEATAAGIDLDIEGPGSPDLVDPSIFYANRAYGGKWVVQRPTKEDLAGQVIYAKEDPE